MMDFPRKWPGWRWEQRGPPWPGLQGQILASGSRGHRVGPEGPPVGRSLPGVQVPAFLPLCAISLAICNSASRLTAPAFPSLVTLSQPRISPFLSPFFLPPHLCLWPLYLPPPPGVSGSLFTPPVQLPPHSLAVCFWVIPAGKRFLGGALGASDFCLLLGTQACPD